MGASSIHSPESNEESYVTLVCHDAVVPRGGVTDIWSVQFWPLLPPPPPCPLPCPPPLGFVAGATADPAIVADGPSVKLAVTMSPAAIGSGMLTGPFGISSYQAE